MPATTLFRNLPIARALRLAFLVLVLLPGLVITAGAYLDSRQALRSEIGHRLHQDASMLTQQLDAFLFERMENLVGWRRLNVMQDASIGDVDKRLSEFLGQLKTGYGKIYRELLVTDTGGTIVASSTPGRIGASLPDGTQPAERITLGDDEIELLPLRHPYSGESVLPMRVTIRNQFEPGIVGYLNALLDWQNVESMLNGVSNDNEKDAFRFAILLDRHNRRIGHSRTKSTTQAQEERLVLQYLQKKNASQNAAPARTASAGQPEAFEVPRSGLLVGLAISPGFQDFPGLGWRIAVIESTDIAFAPIRHLLWLLLGVLAATVFVSLLLAARLSQLIADPITRLAEFSRRYDDTLAPDPPQVEGVSEVKALHDSMARMIARLRQSRLRLVHASKLAAVGELAANLAHEVRTPVGVLLSSSQLLKSEQSLSAEGKELVEFIGSESKRLNQLITLLLESGQPKAPVFAPMDLVQLIDECIGILRSKSAAKEVEIRCQSGPECASIMADAAQLQQVFLNLLLNAIHFAPRGSEVIVACQPCGDGVRIDVEDAGPGVDEADRERIFEPFYTRREGGFGLGLSIVQHIVSEHGGRIEIDRSTRLGGADFRVTLPRHPTATNEKENG